MSMLPPDDGIEMTKHCFVYCGPEHCTCLRQTRAFPDDLVELKKDTGPLVVNLFGAPGAGKSTMALGLTYYLKKAKFNAELVAEYAKDLTFDKRMLGPASLQDQIYIFAKQRARLERLLPHSDVVVTDCPILLGANYYPELFPDSFRELLLWSFNQHNTVNFFLNRVHDYSSVGRRQSAEEADQIAVEMKEFLTKNAIDFIEVAGDDGGEWVALQHLKKLL
jgi:RecA/RadA recombinase